MWVMGKDPAFLRGVEDQGETFVVDVHKNKDQQIYLQDPTPYIPLSKSKKANTPYHRFIRPLFGAMSGSNSSSKSVGKRLSCAMERRGS